MVLSLLDKRKKNETKILTKNLIMRKRPFSPKQVSALRKVLIDNPRDLALLNTAISTCLRSSDLLDLKVSHVRSKWGEILEQIEVKMQKTSKMVTCQLSDLAQDSLERWIRVVGKEPDDYLFTSMRGGKKRITSVAYRKIVKRWCVECGWNPEYFSSHSCRRSLPSHLYSQTKDIRTCQIILGHESPASTALYLGIEEESAFSLVKKHQI